MSTRIQMQTLNDTESSIKIKLPVILFTSRKPLGHQQLSRFMPHANTQRGRSRTQHV